MILLERGSRGLAPSQMSAAGEIFQDLRYATLDPTLDQVCARFSLAMEYITCLGRSVRKEYA